MPLSEKRRVQLDNIVSQRESNKESEDDIISVVIDFKSKYESEQETIPATSQQVSASAQQEKEPSWATRAGFTKESTPQNRTLFGLPKNIENIVLPRSSQVFREGQTAGVDMAAKHPLGFGLDMVSDIAELPKRTLGTLRKNPETGEQYKITEPESGVLNPEGKKIQEKIAGTQLPGIIKKPAIVGTGIIADVLSDPLSFIASPGKTIKKGAQGLGYKFENKILQPREAELKKIFDRTIPDEKGFVTPPVETMAKTIFDNKLAGTPQETLKKTKDLLNKTNDEIIKMAEQSKEKFNIYDAIGRVKTKIESGDKKFADVDNADEALSYLTKKLGRFNLVGSEESAKTALEAKRLLADLAYEAGKEKGGSYEKLAREISKEITDDITKKIPEIKPLNKLYSEVIPIERIAKKAITNEGKTDFLKRSNILEKGLDIGIDFISPSAGKMLNKVSKTQLPEMVQATSRTLSTPSKVARQLDNDTDEEKKRKQQQILQQLSRGR